MAHTFPVLQGLAAKLMENYGPQTTDLMTHILKIFHCSIHLSMPQLMKDHSNTAVWMVFFKMLLDSKVPHELETPTLDDVVIGTREKNPFWKNKKWVSRIMVR